MSGDENPYRRDGSLKFWAQIADFKYRNFTEPAARNASHLGKMFKHSGSK
jgi:hypothetical protein